MRLFSNRIRHQRRSIQLLSRYGEAKEIRCMKPVISGSGYMIFLSIWVTACVTPPSLIPQSGNRVKTDPIDSFKLADYLRTDLLASIYVPTHEERCHRQVSRRRRQFMKDRVRVQLRIKAELRYMGVYMDEESRGRWSGKFVTALGDVHLGDPYAQESFENMLEQYAHLCEQGIARRRCALRKQTRIGPRGDPDAIPGVGWLSAMEILLELQDVARFKSADALAASWG